MTIDIYVFMSIIDAQTVKAQTDRTTDREMDRYVDTQIDKNVDI